MSRYYVIAPPPPRVDMNPQSHLPQNHLPQSNLALDLSTEPQKHPQKSESPLKLLRESIGLSQEKLARECDIPLRTYLRWENGKSVARPSIPQVKALCRVLEISIEELPDNLGPSSSIKN